MTGEALKRANEISEENLGISGLALRWLQIDTIPRLIVNGALRVLWRNIAAERLLLDCPDLDARDGHLTAEDRLSNVRLIELVAGADDDVSTCTAPCIDGDGHLLFQARQLSSSDQGRIALCIQRTGSRFDARYADFSRAFGLTASEYQIVKLLTSGHTADSIASREGSSIGTVRSHIRSIYNKLDVSSREMMFHRLQPFRLS